MEDTRQLDFDDTPTRELGPIPPHEGEYLVYNFDGIKVYPLQECNRIGRSLQADVRLEDLHVSRRHAMIIRQDDKYVLTDDRSTNGVYVNGERIERHVLKDGDEFQVGKTVFRFVKSG